MNVTIYPGRPSGVNFEAASVVKNIAGATVQYCDTEDPFISEGSIAVGASQTLTGTYFFTTPATALLSYTDLGPDLATQLGTLAQRIGDEEEAREDADDALTDRLWIADGNLDLNNVGTGLYGLLREYQTVDGINTPARGDGFLGAAGDAANGAGGSFFLGDTVALNHMTKGSAHIYTAAGVLTDDVSEYGEMGLYEGSIQVDRIGAYVAGMELAIIPTVPARAAGVQIVMQPSDSLADYQTALDDSPNPPSQWAQTGTRSFASLSYMPDAAGTGLALLGNHEYGILAAYTDLTKLLLASVSNPAVPYPFYSINGLGKHAWGVATLAPDTFLERTAVGTLKTPGILDVGGLLRATGIVVLSDSFQIADAADITTSATGGAATALPALPVGYFKMYDVAGNARKVAYYAT